MNIAISKMHCIGNDFVIINLFHQPFNVSKKNLQLLAHRQLGVGCDQVILIEQPQIPNTQFAYRIFNADGSEAEQCGNAALCLGQFAIDAKICSKAPFFAHCLAGRVKFEIAKANRISITLPAIDCTQSSQLLLEHTMHTINLGNPHGIVLVDDLMSKQSSQLAKKLKQALPEDLNLSLVQVIHSRLILSRVFERGAGETLACGSGAAAAVMIGQNLGILDESVEVQFKQGSLQVKRLAPDLISLEGQGTKVFTGTYFAPKI